MGRRGRVVGNRSRVSKGVKVDDTGYSPQQLTNVFRGAALPSIARGFWCSNNNSLGNELRSSTFVLDR